MKYGYSDEQLGSFMKYEYEQLKPLFEAITEMEKDYGRMAGPVGCVIDRMAELKAPIAGEHPEIESAIKCLSELSNAIDKEIKELQKKLLHD